ncbi:hypothetical protein AB0M41_09135 [Streptomyces sp. NPDC051896]|uniref:hypothetical protein n=1 Tax=Streptomyces sp. NPDC051896 TaxID=3155416 RepID=UPI003420781F
MVNLPKIAGRVEILLDLMGLAVGAMLLAAGIGTYRSGGSVGWAIAGTIVFLINFWVAWRRFTRRRKPAPSL